MEDKGRWGGEGNWGKLEGEVNHERLRILKKNLRDLKERGVGAWGKRLVCIRDRMEA